MFRRLAAAILHVKDMPGMRCMFRQQCVKQTSGSNLACEGHAWDEVCVHAADCDILQLTCSQRSTCNGDRFVALTSYS